MATILDGKKLSEKIFDNIKKETDKLSVKPTLVVISVGDNEASKVYVNIKQKTAEKLGFESKDLHFPENITEEELLALINKLNNDDRVNAILVQLPLPKTINAFKIANAINPKKDVDGFHFENVGKLNSNQKPYAVPCTARGILELLQEYNINVEGKSTVVVGRSNIVGSPVARLLQNKNSTVTVCHSKTKNLSEYTKTADIIICAVGKPKLITADMVKAGAIIVDVGISRVDGKLLGDTDFENLKDKVAYISPVPKGVGPMTIASLMQNTLDLYKLQNRL